MSDPKPPANSGSTANHPVPLELLLDAPAEEPAAAEVPVSENVFPADAEPSDDAPTIISKGSSHRGSSANGAADLASTSLRGRTLAHFELIEPIGVGGMAAVIRARDRQLDRPVALKILPPEMSSDPENVRRFHQEARAAARLDHENIARVFYCGEDQRLHFIAFEFVEGVNLRTLLERRGRLPVTEAVHYMLQIAAGLAHAAGRGVVHRDIKPSNIIISPNGRAKLVDMGLARNLGPADDKGLTQSGVTLGTFDYIAPEQAMDPREADVRSDIYALGCTFYHMLTGQAPVPEGTAARKLHHHQHVAPVDPRQLNPSIPDDVAAILQRMMAKEPKDRYQRAEHLVQHLIQVAQKLGAAADVPDGVLFVDAPLPAPPRKRPLLMATVGGIALGLFVIALSLAPMRPHIPVLPGHVGADVKPQPDKGKPAVQESKQPVEPPAGPGPRAVASERDLRDALADASPSLHLQVDRALTISEGGLVFASPGKVERTLVLEAKEKEPALVFIRPPAGADRDPRVPWGGLELTGGKATFRNLHFVLNSETTVAPAALLAGILVKGARSVTFERCTFSQSGVPLLPLLGKRPLVPLASVGAWNPGSDARANPQLDFKQCYFKNGQAAFSLVGSADVNQDNCAFGPHVCLFHLQGDENPKLGTRLVLTNVSAFVVHGPAFRLDKTASCELSVYHSIFSCPGERLLSREADQPDLIHQTDTPVRAVRFVGHHNCFHNLNALWVSPSADPARGIIRWEEFGAAVQEKGGYDNKSAYLDSDSPWESPNPRAEKDPTRAFRVNPRLPAVRQEGGTVALGVLKCAWGNLYPEPLPPLPEQPVVAENGRKPNEKVVDPSTKGLTPGVYSTVAGAIANAKPGDVILLKHTGPLPVDPILLAVDANVTIRPDEGYRPLLTLADKAIGEALFTVSHGQLQFEGVEFLLRPAVGEDERSVVAVGGNGQVGFKQCAVTLEVPEGRSAPLHVVTLTEARGAAKLAPAKVPAIRLQQCFVRGEGDLLAVRPGRPFKLAVEGSLVALSGSLVNIPEVGTREYPPGTEAAARLDLTRTTTYLGEHLLALRSAGGGRGVVYAHVTASRCLFAAAGTRSLVYLDGPQSTEQARRTFGWLGDRNTYAGYEVLMEQQPSGEEIMPQLYRKDGWKAFANEDPEAQFTSVKFDAPAPARRLLSQVTLDELRPTPEPGVELQGTGAALDQLPRPRRVDGPRALLPEPPARQPGDDSFGEIETAPAIRPLHD